MNVSNPMKFFLYVAVAALAFVMLAPASHVLAYGTMHPPADASAAWNTCVGCHGADLTGNPAATPPPPSCMSCHNDFGTDELPPTGHNRLYGFMDHTDIDIDARLDPIENCAGCHGGDLTGAVGPSCFTCHDQVWPGGYNSPPNLDSGGPYAGAPGQEIQFDAGGTTDPDGDNLTFLWLFGDGSPPQYPSRSPTTTHAYTEVGSYTALLTVTDGVNDPEIVEVIVEISLTSNSPPLVNPGGPYSGTEDQLIQFQASGTTDPDGDTLTYIWDFGDGSAPALPRDVPTISHTYENPGSYIAELTVSDGVNSPVTENVTVEVAEREDPPSGGGGGDGGGGGSGGWLIRIPYLFAELTITTEDFAGVMLFEATHANGEVTYGIGMEFDGIIFWMDTAGTVFFGNIDHDAGTIRGVVFDYNGGNSIFLGDRL